MHASFTHAWRATDFGFQAASTDRTSLMAHEISQKKNNIYISAKANLRLAKLPNVATHSEAVGRGVGGVASGVGKLICLKRNSLSFGVFYFFQIRALKAKKVTL